jgi:hypothetical protein
MMMVTCLKHKSAFPCAGCDQEISVLRTYESELSRLKAENARLRDILESAADTICSEFCGRDHHSCCIKEALKSAGGGE